MWSFTVSFTNLPTIWSSSCSITACGWVIEMLLIYKMIVLTGDGEWMLSSIGPSWVLTFITWLDPGSRPYSLEVFYP
jgi:hypothetical protein